VEKEVNTPDRDSTRTDLAMQLTENELFTRDGGHRPNARSALLLITDGRPVFFLRHMGQGLQNSNFENNETIGGVNYIQCYFQFVISVT